MFKYILSVVIILITFNRIFSQEQTFSDLDTVLISTTRLQQRLNETGRSVTVIPAAQLRSYSAHTIDDLLRFVPGVEIQGRNGFGVQADISIRGATFTQVLILIDGVRFNDPLTGHFNNYLPIPFTEIDRIEVLRGTAGSLYGPDAVGGVIHVITKNFSSASQEKGFSAKAEILGGEYGLLSAQGGLQWNTEALGLGLGGAYHDAKGQLLPTEIRNDFSVRNAALSLRYKLSPDWILSARTAIDYRLFNAQYFYTRSTADLSRERTSHVWNQVQLHRSTGKAQTTLALAVKTNQDSFLFNPNFAANIHSTDFYLAQVQQSYTLNSKWQLSGGIQADYRSIKSTDRGDHDAAHAGMYLAAYYKPANNWGLTPSLRLDWDENFGLEALPHLSAFATLGRLQFRASLGRSIRAADFTERFVSNNLPAPLAALRNFGNRDLKAESAWNFELGADYSLNAWSRLSVTGFHRLGKNLIDYVITNADEIPYNETLIPGSNYFYPQNLFEVNTTGVETALWLQTPQDQALSFSAGFGYMYLDTYNDAGIVSKYLSNSARHLFTSHLILVKKPFSFVLDGLWKERDGDFASSINSTLEKSYMVWNGRLEIGILQDRLQVLLQADNIFDSIYQDILGAQMPRRWLMGGLRWGWKGK